MTPSKTKKVLPSSTSVAFPEQPISYEQWKAVLGQVKVMYLRNQWKQCSARCRQLLLEAKTPVRAVASDITNLVNKRSSPILYTPPSSISTPHFQTKQSLAQCTISPRPSFLPLNKPRSRTKRQLRHFPHTKLSQMSKNHKTSTPHPKPRPLSPMFLRVHLLRF